MMAFLCPEHTYLGELHIDVEGECPGCVIENQASQIQELEAKTARGDHDRELMRKQLWMSVAIAVARATNSSQKESCCTWANHVLEQFDKKFRD